MKATTKSKSKIKLKIPSKKVLEVFKPYMNLDQSKPFAKLSS